MLFQKIRLFGLIVIVIVLFSSQQAMQANSDTALYLSFEQEDGVVIDYFGIEMIYVPAGTVEMGVTREESTDVCMGNVPSDMLAEWTDERRSTYIEDCLGEVEPSIYSSFEVAVDGFWIDKYEFTYEHANSICPTCVNIPADIDDNMPITDINWFDAYRFCVNRGARLSSEAEWEYAASGPDNNSLTWGGLDLSEYLTPIANTQPVGSLAGDVSWIGIYDMACNVSEWVDGQSLPYPNYGGDWDLNWIDTYRVVRGGTWQGSILYGTTYYRHHDVMTAGEAGVGFRCARTSHPRQYD